MFVGESRVSVGVSMEVRVYVRIAVCMCVRECLLVCVCVCVCVFVSQESLCFNISPRMVGEEWVLASPGRRGRDGGRESKRESGREGGGSVGKREKRGARHTQAC